MTVKEQLEGKISRTGGKGACMIGFWSEQQEDGGSVLQGGLTAKGSGLEIPYWLPRGMDTGFWCIPAMLPSALET